MCAQTILPPHQQTPARDLLKNKDLMQITKMSSAG
jgi:hypothetical protein